MNSARRLQHRTGTQEWGEGGVISYLRGIKSAGPSASNTVLKPDWMTGVANDNSYLDTVEAIEKA